MWKQSIASFFLVCTAFFAGPASFAQQAPEQDRVVAYLTKGAVLRGELVAMDVGISYTLLSIYGDTITIPEQYLRKIEYTDRIDGKKIHFERSNDFQTKGFYHTAAVALNLNTVSRNDGGLMGYALSATLGHQVNRWIGYGVGFGLDAYHPHQNEMVFPLYLEGRGYLLDQAVTPYYTIRAGYGFVFDNEEVGLIGGSGGLMFNPAIGWRLSGRKGMNMTLDLGLQFQRATFDWWQNSERAMMEVTYKRLNIRLGFLF